MNLKPFVINTLFLTLLFSCSPEISEKEQLKSEVIAIHDEVMPKIGDLKTQQKDLLGRATNLEKGNEAEHHHMHIQELRSTAHACEEAYDNMFVWMRQFENEYSDMTDDEANAYLSQQLNQVKKVNQDIKTALQKADSLLSVSL